MSESDPDRRGVEINKNLSKAWALQYRCDRIKRKTCLNWLDGRRHKGGMNLEQGRTWNLGTHFPSGGVGADEAVVAMKRL